MEVQGSIIALLILFLALEAKAQGKNDCQRLDKMDYCRNNSRIRVTKDKKDYHVRFCSNDQCMSDAVGDMNLKIRCSDVCDVCKSLPGQNECRENGNCEEQVDKFFDEYCLSAGNMATTFENLVSTGTNCTPTSKVGGQVSPDSIMQTADRDSSSSESGIVIALGALLGLSTVLLAVVTTGWVCTCVSMRRREKSDSEMTESTEESRMASESIRKSKKDDKEEDDDDDNEERYFKNPTYEGTMNTNGVSSATYETVNLSNSTKITIENDQTYAVPDKQRQVDGTYMF